MSAQPIDRGPALLTATPWLLEKDGDCNSFTFRIVDEATRAHYRALRTSARPNYLALIGHDGPAVVHRVNTYDAICDRAERAEVEVSRLLADVNVAEAAYFAAGGMPSMIDRSRDPEWYRRRMVKLLERRAEKAERERDECIDTLRKLQHHMGPDGDVSTYLSDMSTLLFEDAPACVGNPYTRTEQQA